MTIPYDGSFFRSVFRWKGSVWKSIWRDLIMWLIAYYTIKVLLIFTVPHGRKQTVRSLISLFDSYTTRLPLEFLLGFYVTTTVNRWWAQTLALCSPQNAMGTIASYLPVMSDSTKHVRHTVARYLVLYHAISYRNISSKIKELFPNNQSFVDVGLMTDEERQIVDGAPQSACHEIPFQWICELLRSHINLTGPILKALTKQRTSLSVLNKHNAINVPLVYTQTVTIAVYGYFTFCLIGHQFYEPESKIDTLVPFLTILRFIFGVGWLKVAQDLAKPFGVDDDDIDLCKMLSSYCTSVFTIADYIPMRHPLKSWATDESQYEKIKSCFDAGITKYETNGHNIMIKMKKLMEQRNRIV